MYALIPVAAFFAGISLFIIGCDFSDGNIPDDANKPATAVIKNSSNTPDQNLKEPSKALDLTLPSETTELLQQPEQDFLAPIEAESTSLPNKPKQEKDITFGGKVHLGDNKKDYREAVEGAEVEVEVKFK